MKKGDIFVILILFVLCFTLFLFLTPKKPAAWAEVTVDGEVVARLPLTKDTTLELPHQTLRVQDGKVFMEESDCPGQDCVRAGAVSRSGQTLVCLPNRVVVTLSGRGDYDAVSG